jgi:hypothetical protein
MAFTNQMAAMGAPDIVTLIIYRLYLQIHQY